jgi:Uma2 family endonuclease
MSAQPKLYFTLEEYYGLEKASDRRWEYWDGEIVCMSGGLRNHGQISGNAHGLLFSAIDRQKCSAFTGEQAVRADTSSGYVYPDASVACDPQYTRHQERGIDLLTNPIIVVEVTSNNSKMRDHNRKLEAYRLNDSLRDYIIIESDRLLVTHYQRAGGDWRKITHTRMDDIIETSMQINLAVSDLYLKSDFKDSDDSAV